MMESSNLVYLRVRDAHWIRPVIRHNTSKGPSNYPALRTLCPTATFRARPSINIKKDSGFRLSVFE